MATPDMEVIKEIPGYKVILKAVLKYQIQQLVEMLATSTDEESVILTASVSDGTLSHLGSESGKVFLEDHDDVKSQFLGFCLKRHHKRKQLEKEKELAAKNSPPLSSLFPASVPPRQSYTPRGRQSYGPRSSSPLYPGPSTSGYRAPLRHEPYPVSKPSRSNSFESSPAQDTSKSSIIKQEPMDSHSDNMVPSSDNIRSRTGSAQDNDYFSADATQDSNQSSDGTMPNTPGEMKSESDFDPNVNVKTEHNIGDEPEITGVEPNSNSGATQDWAPENDPALLYNSTPGLDFSASGADFNELYSSYVQQDKHESEKEEADISNSNTAPAYILSDDSTARARKGRSRNYDCAECGKSFRDRWSLNTHFRVHSGEKPFKCDVCERRFNTKGNCRAHTLTHLRTSFH